MPARKKEVVAEGAATAAPQEEPKVKKKAAKPAKKEPKPPRKKAANKTVAKEKEVEKSGVQEEEPEFEPVPPPGEELPPWDAESQGVENSERTPTPGPFAEDDEETAPFDLPPEDHQEEEFEGDLSSTAIRLATAAPNQFGLLLVGLLKAIKEGRKPRATLVECIKRGLEQGEIFQSFVEAYSAKAMAQVLAKAAIAGGCKTSENQIITKLNDAIRLEDTKLAAGQSGQ